MNAAFSSHSLAVGGIYIGSCLDEKPGADEGHGWFPVRFYRHGRQPVLSPSAAGEIKETGPCRRDGSRALKPLWITHHRLRPSGGRPFFVEAGHYAIYTLATPNSACASDVPKPRPSGGTGYDPGSGAGVASAASLKSGPVRAVNFLVPATLGFNHGANL